jgi:hypothetical protein
MINYTSLDDDLLNTSVSLQMIMNVKSERVGEEAIVTCNSEGPRVTT